MKKVLGLILELNPFHNGHKYFIEEAIKNVKPDVVIAITSGNYTMRGELSVIDKFTKTNLLLETNIDLVLELPFLSTMNSANLFALNSLSILKNFKITDLAFGVELTNLDLLHKMKEIINSDLYNNLIKDKLSLGNSYSTSSYLTLKELSKDETIIENFTLPNNTLAIQYLNSIEQLQMKVNTHLIKRIDNNYYDEVANTTIASATSLRLLLEDNKDISNYVPKFKNNIKYINLKNAEENLFNLIKYNFYTSSFNTISNYLTVDEGIESRIYNFLDNSITYNSLIKNVQTKRYSANKIKRMLMHIVMNTSNKYADKANFYLRMLGASEAGLKFINTLPKSVKEKIITSFKNKENNKLVQLELKASRIYDLLTNQDLYKNEFLVPIIGGKNDNKRN